MSLISKTEQNEFNCPLQAKSCFFLNLMNVSCPLQLTLEPALRQYDEAHRLRIPTRFNLNILDRSSLFLLILCPNFLTRTRLTLHLRSRKCCNSSLKKVFCFVSGSTNVKLCYLVPLYIFYTQSLQVFLINQQNTV